MVRAALVKAQYCQRSLIKYAVDPVLLSQVLCLSAVTQAQPLVYLHLWLHVSFQFTALMFQTLSTCSGTDGQWVINTQLPQKSF